MEITLKNISRVCLQEEAYLKLVRKYAAGLKKKLVIIFDKRIADFGHYNYDAARKLHVIRISVKMCCFRSDGTKYDDNAEKYHIIATTIHELKHAKQQEELGREFWSKWYSCASEIDNSDVADFFSVCEVEARIYENTHVLPAVDYYNSYCK